MQAVCDNFKLKFEAACVIKPGENIAIKVPLHRWEETVAFYRDRVGLRVKKQSAETAAFEFGAMTLWIDRVERQSQVDVWLELLADDPDGELARLGSPNRDELEPLDGVDGHWTSDPAGVVLLVRRAQ
jgi:catechol 2,3-dioxygenase-like lactoylglutathione lyase family enzyme